MTDTEINDDPEQWALVEIMGHRRCAGRVKQVERFGAQMLQVDIPHADGFTTEFYGGASIYAFRPCTEEIARNVAEQIGDPRPVMPSSYRERTPPPALSHSRYDEDDDQESMF